MRQGEQLVLGAHASIDHNGDPERLWQDRKAFSALIKTAIKAAGCKGKRVVACLPAQLVRVMPLSYQASSGRSDAEAIAGLLSERIGSEASDFIVDYMPVETVQPSNQKLALVALSREETVTAFLSALDAAGLEVEALEIGPLAIRRLVSSLMRNLPPQNTLVVNCGRRQSYLTLIADERLLADDEIAFGEEALIETICERLDIDSELAQRLVCQTDISPDAIRGNNDPEQIGRTLSEVLRPELRRLAKEIDRGLVYATSESRGARRNMVYLLGSLARWPGADQLLESVLGVPVARVPNPVSLFGGNRDDGAPELAIATGLALRSFGRDR